MGAEFIAREGILQGLILSLDRGEEWTIGRDPDVCTIVIEDPQSSRKAARIFKEDGHYFIENLSDTNPVLVNEAPIEESTELSEGDAVTIGGSLFVFYPEGAPSAYGFQAESDLPEADFTEEFSEAEPDLEEEEREPTAEEEEIFEEPEELEEEPEEEEESEEITPDLPFDEEQVPQLDIDLTQTTRFVLKVIAGPNTGAEFALDLDASYLIGTDAAKCDIVFNDLSVSREHARLVVDREGNITIEDLRSRNGVLVDGERIGREKELGANGVVSLGTSTFLLIDRETPSETIVTPFYEPPVEEEEEAEEEEISQTPVEAPAAEVIAKSPPMTGTLILSLIIAGLAVLVGIGMVSLFQSHPVERVEKDYLAELQGVMKDYPAVRFTYNKSSNKLFLMGHVRSGIEHNELLYKLQGLPFIKGIEDNIVNDEAVWQEMNILLSKHLQFKGVSMHAPQAGEFVISGYLETEKQAADLMDYLNVNFNYLGILQNRVVVDQAVMEEVSSKLLQQGFGAVNVTFSNGDLQLTGYISSTQGYAFEQILEDIKEIPGVRTLRNFVVAVTPEQGVIDLNRKYPGRYRVTGHSTHGDMNINVVVNGKILGRGDAIDGYTITSIQPTTIFLEREGLKYKIEYNK